MKTNSEIQKSWMETTKWTAIVFLIIASVSVYLYHDVAISLRILIMIILITVAIYIALLTEKGKLVVSFIREIRTEVRNIVWPTHQQTLYTTLVVAIVSSVMSLVLWGLDNILVYLISFTLA